MSRTWVTPGAWRSTTNIVADSSPAPGVNRAAPGADAPSVRAITMRNAASPPPVEYHLCPVIFQPSPSFSARVARFDGSAPAPGAGSVMQKALEISAAQSGSSHRARTGWLADTRKSSMFP